MRCRPSLGCLLLVGWSLVTPVTAQTRVETSPVAISADRISPVGLRAQLDAVTADSTLDDVLRQALIARYGQAISFATQAEKFRALAEEYRRALLNGEAESAALRREAGQVRDEDPAVAIKQMSPDADLSALLAVEQTRLAALRSELQQNEESVAAFRTRPDAILDRLDQAKSELKDNAAEIARLTVDAGSPGATATSLLLAAQKEALEGEISALNQENLSSSIRRSREEAARDLCRSRVALAERRVETLRQQVAQRLSNTLSHAENQLAQLDITTQPELLPLVTSIQGLIDETHRVSDSLHDTDTKYKERKAEESRIENSREDLVGQLQLGGDATNLSPLLLEQLRRLPTRREGKQRLAEIRNDMATARTGQFQIDQTLRGQDLPQAPSTHPVVHSSQQRLLEDLQQTLRVELKAHYDQWIRDLNDFAAVEREITEEAAAFRAFAEEKLFWLRSSPPVGSATVKRLPEAIHYCVGLHRLGDLASRLVAMGLGFLISFASVVILSVAAAIWAGRRLTAISIKARHYSTDSYRLTTFGVGLTALIALPCPLALAGLGMALRFQEDASDWSTGLGVALVAISIISYHLLFLIHVCGKNGLGIHHFGWDPAMLHRLRRKLLWALPVYAVAALIIVLVRAEPTVSYLGDLGRLALLFFVVASGSLLASMMHPVKGAAATIHRLAPESLFGRLRHVWYWLIVIIVLILVGLLLAGYVFTVLLLVEKIDTSFYASAGTLIVYAMLMRFFALRESKLARGELVKKLRNQRKEARKSETPPVPSTAQQELSAEDLEFDEKMDLTEVKAQTRKFVGFVAGMALLVQLYSIWVNFGPVVDVLRGIKTHGGINPVDAIFVLVVLSMIVSTVRNLPGMMEILIFGHTQIDSGTRNAIVTLAKYAVIAVGAVVLFRNLGVDWSQFGWIAAALGVGIGFGLQEVVANFISGIVLLFERPIRVGDIVTVDGIDGVVSHIQIRATTITNWDRKEFIVPNKQFITGTLLNWTRTNSINRITIPVGVAYGSDTALAMKILIEIANSHPRLLKDPAPFATFEAFGDSALNLVLRSYLPNFENRLGTITELHCEIDRRFREAGIQIAFPQMDVHLDVTSPIPGSLR